MRHNQNRRSRGRSRKGPNPLTRSYESNGPDVKVRGTAAHVAEKYMTLARDAQSSGDPVAAENYLQHAEHYYRIVMAAQAQFQQSQPQFREGGEDGYEDDRQANGRGRFDYNGRDEDDGDDRFEGEGEEDRFRPMQSQQGDRQQGDRQQGDRQQGERQQGDRQQGDRPQGDRQQQRGPRDRYDRRDRPDYQNRERYQRQDEPQPEPPQAAPEAVEAAPPAPPPSEEPRASQPRRRRRRNDNGEAGADETTPDGAAALAAFPD